MKAFADLLDAMSEDLGAPVKKLRVDGGAAANNLLMQEQANLAAATIERPHDLETTARGAAMLAALGAGLFKSKAEAAQMAPIERRFTPSTTFSRDEVRAGWKSAVARARTPS